MSILQTIGYILTGFSIFMVMVVSLLMLLGVFAHFYDKYVYDRFSPPKWALKALLRITQGFVFVTFGLILIMAAYQAGRDIWQ